jgi:hypothetical protein
MAYNLQVGLNKQLDTGFDLWYYWFVGELCLKPIKIKGSYLNDLLKGKILSLANLPGFSRSNFSGV